MKKILILPVVAMILFASCQTKTKNVTVNADAEKAALTDIMTRQYSLFDAKDIKTYMTLYTDDALLIGTDPGEFWTKTEVANQFTQMVADTSLKIKFIIDKREVKLATDGNSALAVEQVQAAFLSPKIPVRIIYHFIKNNGTWQVDFCAYNFIPKNDDIARLNKALE